MPNSGNSFLARTNRRQRYYSEFSGFLWVFVLLAFSSGFSLFLLARYGIPTFLVTLIGIFVGLVYLVISLKSLAVPFYMTVLSIGGLRFLVAIKAPLLPDLYLDRIMLLWLILIFMIKFFAEGRRLKGPYLLDILILAHGSYILGRIWAFGFESFSPWTSSILLPYSIYFFSKNIIETKRQLQILYILLIVLGFYYSVSSIAQKYQVDAILYPTYMRIPSTGWPGRSTGPYSNPGIFGMVLGMILPIHLYFLAIIHKHYIKVLLWFSMAVGLLGLYFTYTRGAWMCSISGIVTVVILNRQYYFRSLIPVLMLAPIFGVLFLGLNQDAFMKDRVENDETIEARLGVSVTALRVWKDYPFFGCGSFRYDIVRHNYIEPVKVPGFKVIRFVQYRHTTIHDMYLGPLAEDGLVGMGLVLAIYLVNVRNLLRIYRRRSNGDHFAIFIIPLFLGVMVSYLNGGFTQSFRYAAIMGTMLFMTSGIAAGYDPEKFESEFLIPEEPSGPA